MRRMNSKSVDLIYLDPPFNSKANYAAPIGSKAAGSEFRDTWYLDDIDKEWIQTLASKHPKLHRVLLASMVNSDKAYLAYMAPRMIEMHRILKGTGSIYLHCDTVMSHYLKLVMDAIFGRSQFQNEFIWLYEGRELSKKRYNKKHDCILFYTKGKTWTFNWEAVADDLKESSKKALFRFTDEQGRPYLLRYKKGGGFAPKELEGSDEVYIQYPSDKIPPKDYAYFDYARKSERTGYRTQKPEALLDKIIDASSNEGDIVFDPFCGCATTLVAAEFRPQRRQWVGIDVSPKAVELVVDRIKEKQGMFDEVISRRDIPQRTDLGKLAPPRSHFDYLYGKQRGYCNGCREHKNPDICDVDHIIAKSKGGTDHVDNLQMLCHPCNMKKGNKSMEYLTLANKRLKEILEIK